MTYIVRPYERQHREHLLNALFYSRRVHSHLDWYRPGQWLELADAQVFSAWAANSAQAELCGFIGMSSPLNGAAWLRLGAIQNTADPHTVLDAVWSAAYEQLYAQGARVFAVLVINQWLKAYLSDLGFRYLEDVVTLQRSGQGLPAERKPHRVRIKPGYLEDLPELERIDHAAFDPPWQLSLGELRQSQRQAASCTLAELDGELVGYQLSTRHQSSGHLARLAVVPGYQGQRIGTALLHDLIRNFNRRGVRSMTVNTQISNHHSQRLYQRYGFRRNGFDLPIWLRDDRQPTGDL